MAGFGAKSKSKTNNKSNVKKNNRVTNNKQAKGNSKSAPSKNARNSKNVNQSRNFNVDSSETTTLRKAPSREVSDKDLEKLAEKVELPRFISDVKSCDEKFFIHMINHSKTKEFDPFIIGSVDSSVCENLDQYIRESKEEFVPSDTVDLSNGKKLVALER